MRYRASAIPTTTRNQAHRVIGADFTGGSSGRTPATIGRTRKFTRFLAGSIAALLTMHSAHAVTLTWDSTAGAAPVTDGAGAWLGTNQWFNGTTWQSWVSGSDAVFGNGGAGGAVTLGGATTVNSLVFNAFTGTYTLGTAGSVMTLNNGILINAGAGAVTIISPVTLGGSQSWTNNGANTFTVSGAIVDGTNTLTLDGTGNGLTTMTNGLSISGAAGLVIGKSGTLGVTINGGTITLGGTGGININSLASAVTLGANLVQASQAWTNNSASTFTVSGLTSGSANTLTLAGTGAGLTTLTGGLNLSGTGGLIISKSGTNGTVIGGTSNLAGTGGITINSGASAFTLGTATIAAVQSWANNSSNVMTVSGAQTINTQLSLTAGTIKFTGANTGAASVVINGATVQAGNAASFVGSGQLFLTSGTLSSDGGTARSFGNTVNINGSVTLGNATNNGALSFTATTNITGSNTITLAGSGAVTFSTGTMVLPAGSNTTFNSASAALTLSGGYNANGGTATLTLNTGANAVNLSGIVAGANGVLDLAGSGTNVTVGTLTGITSNAVRVSGSGSYTFNGTSSITGGVILNNAAATVIATTAGGLGATSAKVKFNVAGTALTLQNNTGTAFTSGLDSSTNGGTIVVNRATAGAVATTHSLTLANTLGNTLTMSAGGNITSGTAYGLTLSGATSLSGNTILQINNNGAGTGTLTLGAVTANGNILTLTGAGNFAQTGAIAGTGTSAFVLDTTYTGIATLNQTNSVTGGFKIGNGTLRLSAISNATDGNLVTIGAAGNTSATLDLNGGSRDINSLAYGGGTATITNSVTTAATLNYNGATTSSFGGVLQNGPGTIGVTVNNAAAILTLSGANTYTGATAVTAGTLRAGVTSVPGVSGAFGKDSAVTMTNAASAKLDLAGFNTRIGSLAGGGAAGGNVTLGGATLTTGGNNAATTTYAGIISGVGSFNKIGTGNMTLSGLNTYTGSTTVAQGTLSMGVANALPSTTDLILGTASSSVTGIVDLKSFSQTVNSIGLAAGNTGGSGNVITNSNVSGATLTVSSTTTNSVFAGTISGVVSLTKSGIGTSLKLTGTNTYSGPTTITDGTIEVALGSTVNGSSQVYAGFTVANNGNLLLTGGAMTTGAGYLGNVAGSTGTATITSGSWDTGSNAIYVGYYGTGTMNLAGGSLTDQDGYVGYQPGSNGTATISGGTWDNSQAIYVGFLGNGALNVTGGDVTNQFGYVGYDAAATGNVTVSSGSWSNTSDLTVGFDGTGTVNITDTGAVHVDGLLFPDTGTVTLAANAGSTGTLNLGTGGVAGTLYAAEVNGGSGTATVNFNQTGTYNFAPRLTGSLAVNKLGSGLTNLTANNTYTGATTVSGGTLAVTGSATGTGSIKVNAGGTLLLNSTANASNYVGNGSATPVPLTNLAVVNPGSTSFTGNGGTLAVATGQSGTTHTFSSLTLSANSTLDFSSGPGTTNTGVNLFFGSMASGTVSALQAGTLTLSIDNWTTPNNYNPGATADTGFFGDGQDRLLFTSDPGFGLGVTIPGISFNGTLGQEVAFGGFFEIVPVPEPTTVLGAAGLLGFLGYRERRRVRSLWKGRILPKLASLGSFFRLARTWLAALAVTLAFLGGSTVKAGEFFDDGILRGTKSIHTEEISNRGSLLDSAFTLEPAADAFVGIGFTISADAAPVAAPEVLQPTVGQESLALVSVPEPTAILGVLGVLGFICFRERRRVHHLWSRSMGRRLPSLAFSAAKPAKA
jgi:autotransporter-associated beta strand protein